MSGTTITNRKSSSKDGAFSYYPSIALKASGVKHVERACIATHPLLKNEVQVRPASVIKIVGYDGPNLKEEYPHWTKLLEKWLDTGCEIQYLLLKPKAFAIQKLEELANKTRGKLIVYTLSRRGVSSVAAQYIAEWKTFHFAIFNNPRQLWVETYHPPAETFASNCYFVSQEAAVAPGLLDIYQSRFELVVSNHGRCVVTNVKKLPRKVACGIRRTNAALEVR